MSDRRGPRAELCNGEDATTAEELSGGPPLSAVAMLEGAFTELHSLLFTGVVGSLKNGNEVTVHHNQEQSGTIF